MNANPCFSDVSGGGWGIFIDKDFDWSLKKRSKELHMQKEKHHAERHAGPN